VLRGAIPKADAQGISFGNSWVSFDAMTGCNFETEEKRRNFYATSFIAKGLIEWVNAANQALRETGGEQ